METHNRYNQLLKKSLVDRLKSFLIYNLIMLVVMGIIFLIVYLVARDEMTNFFQVITIVPIMFYLITIPVYICIYEAVKKSVEFNLFITHNQTRSTYLRISSISRSLHFIIVMLEIVAYRALLKPSIERAIAVEGNFDESDLGFFEFILNVSVFQIAIYIFATLVLFSFIGYFSNFWITSPKLFALIWTPAWIIIWSMMINPWNIFTKLFSLIGSFLSAIYGAPLLVGLIVLAVILIVFDIAWTKRLSATEWGGPVKI